MRQTRGPLKATGHGNRKSPACRRGGQLGSLFDTPRMTTVLTETHFLAFKCSFFISFRFLPNEIGHSQSGNCRQSSCGIVYVAANPITVFFCFSSGLLQIDSYIFRFAFRTYHFITSLQGNFTTQRTKTQY